MSAIAYYLLKVIICSGILYGYYRVALHNKTFHRWNRFFLLVAVITSLSFPLIKISILHDPADSGQIIKLLSAVATGDGYLHEAELNGIFQISGAQVAMAIYIVASLTLLAVLIHTLAKLNRLIRSNPLQKMHRVHVVYTEVRGTPFSFFNYIFWNRNINMHADTGAKIFTHEMVHVTEKHSVDKLFMHLVLIFFWCNPFFWLIRREMNMIHEFIADSKAIEDKDTTTFAAMLLQTAYPQQAFGLTSRFFSSFIKRRLFMLTKKQNPRISYISRILALPFLAFIFTAFSIKTERLSPGNNQGVSVWEQPVTLTKKDTLPENIKSVDITKDNLVIIIYQDNTAEKITKAEAYQRGIVSPPTNGIQLRGGKFNNMDSVLFFLDGVEITRSDLEKIPPSDIENISVLKDKSSVDKYGQRGRNGAIEVSLKKSGSTNNVIFSKEKE